MMFSFLKRIFERQMTSNQNQQQGDSGASPEPGTSPVVHICRKALRKRKHLDKEPPSPPEKKKALVEFPSDYEEELMPQQIHWSELYVIPGQLIPTPPHLPIKLDCQCKERGGDMLRKKNERIRTRKPLYPTPFSPKDEAEEEEEEEQQQVEEEEVGLPIY